tara:strand:+ start:32142 stop:32438 length:297 start_codon:yes stop_codon:yes gene_type:complete
MCKQSGFGSVFIEAHTNASSLTPYFDMFSELTSKYSGKQGSFDHPYPYVLSRYFDIYKIELIDQRKRTRSVNFFQMPWIICARNWNRKKFFYDFMAEG